MEKEQSPKMNMIPKQNRKLITMRDFEGLSKEGVKSPKVNEHTDWCTLD